MKKIISVALTLIFAFSLPLYAFAFTETSGANLYIWTSEDGTIIQYYLDEDGLPYILEDNKKAYIGLPLPQFKITDESVLNKLNEEVQKDNDDALIMLADTPTNFVDLSVNPNTASKSISYSDTYSFANYTTHTTPIFRMNGNHSKIRFRTDNIKPLIGDHRISFVIRLYHSSENAWYKYQYNKEKCTSVYGFPFTYLSECHYAQYTLLIPEKVTSYTGVFWTTYD